nr:AAA family ATPase [Archaeoglobus sp.]
MQRLKNLKVSSISKLIEENYKRKSSDIWTEFLYVDFRKKQRKDLVNELYKTTLLKNYLPFLIIFKTAILLPLNLTEIKYKRILPTDEPLKERGENALDILALTQLRENKLPDRIEYALETYFNGRGYFKERNFYFYDLNTRTEFSKEHLPEGMLKLIVILTALERNPAILMIDEVENSLHPELLEFLVEVLKESEGSVFLTTHSPVVLNLVEPEDVLIFKPTTEGVEIRNLTEFKSKEDLLKELEELGINLSDKVFFGLT